MTRTVCLLPQFMPHAIGGVAGHVRSLAKHLPALGWDIESSPYDANIVHTHAVARSNGIDVYTSHGIHPLSGPLAGWQKEQNQAALENLRLARHVIAVSQWTANQWLALVGAVRYHVIPNGIDLDAWTDVPRGHWRTRLKIGKETPLILWPKTSFSPVLDPTPAIEIALRNPDAIIVMPLQRGTLPTAPANVRLIGPQPFASMQALIADCDVYLATTQENHSIGVLEAMALGRVVLGYDWGGTSETITDGVDGALVAPGDMDALDARLDEILDRSNSFGQAARQTVADRFQWSDLVPRTIEVYEMALAEAHAAGDAGRAAISIIIPVYNKAAYVKDAVLSALSQTGFPRCEVIAVNDGSTDGSLAILRELEERYSNTLTVIDQPNQGVSAARNNGIRASHGEFICCLDADDMIDPPFIARTYAAMQADPGLGIAYTDFLAFGERDGVPFEAVIQCSEWSFDLLKQRNYLPCCNLFRRAGIRPSIPVGRITSFGSTWRNWAGTGGACQALFSVIARSPILDAIMKATALSGSCGELSIAITAIYTHRRSVWLYRATVSHGS
jgi:glycosyltransferase involved in cell wall biosynthesis